MAIEQNRQEDLNKLALSTAQVIDGMNVRVFEKPELIGSLSRAALGIEPTCDISGLQQEAQTELLFVMRTVRDITFGIKD